MFNGLIYINDNVGGICLVSPLFICCVLVTTKIIIRVATNLIKFPNSFNLSHLQLANDSLVYWFGINATLLRNVMSSNPSIHIVSSVCEFSML